MRRLCFRTDSRGRPAKVHLGLALLICFQTTLWAGEAVELGSRRELFVDHFLIEKLEGAQLRLHEPRREGVALKFDRPWEGGFSCYTTVMKDGGRYRMYYRGLPTAGRDASLKSVVCYAESASNPLPARSADRHQSVDLSGPQMHQSYCLQNGARETGLGRWLPGSLRSSVSAKLNFHRLTMPREN